MSANEFGAYFASRVLRWRIAALWLLLVVACTVTAADPPGELAWRALACALFVAGFRLWDDLADLDHDRRHHPQRVLARAPRLAPFRAARWALVAALVGLVGFAAGSRPALALLVLIGALGLVYLVLPARRPFPRGLRAVLVLLKYPAFVLLLAAEPAKPAAAFAALLLFVVPLADEARHGGAAVVMPALVLLAVMVFVWALITG